MSYDKYKLSELHSIIENGFPTDLYDIHGREIRVGDTIRFLKCPVQRGSIGDSIWEATVAYADGVFTIDCYKNVKQIENPINWEQDYDYIDSRGWCVSVGYGESGTWNVYRRPLIEIQTGFGWTNEHFKEFYKSLGDKYGYGKRIINVEVVEEVYG